MKKYEYIDKLGTFRMEQPEKTSYLYFPIAGESGLKSCVTPTLGGDSKIDQNTFLLRPESVEDLHNLKSTRNFWCILNDNKIWSATGQCAESEVLKDTDEEEKVTLEAGLMWHTLTRVSSKYRLTSKITNFVPKDDRTFEIMKVEITNDSDKEIKLTGVSAIPMYGRSADNLRDHRHVTSLLHRVKVVSHGLEITPTLTFDERGHKKNTKTYFAYGIGQDMAPVACCPNVEDFIGEGGSFTRPEQIYKKLSLPGWMKENDETQGLETIAAMQFAPVMVAPKNTVTFCLYLGIMDAANKEEVRAGILSDYAKSSDVDAALEHTRKYWNQKINVTFDTESKDKDGYLAWVTFQPILRRIYGCSFLPYHDYGKGGRGWRDLWQDCLALLMMEPQPVREMLLDNFGGVRMDGTNATIIGAGKGEFIADRNSITRVWMDHGLWPYITTQFYLNQSGDLAFLEEEVTYFKDRQIYRSDKKDELWDESQGTLQLDAKGNVVKGSVLEHILLQNLASFYDVGANNHIRLRGADWNDAYDMAAANGESVTFTAAYMGNLSDIADMLERYEAMGHEKVTLQKEIVALLQKDTELFDSIEKKKALMESYYASCAHTISGEKVAVDIKEIIESLRAMSDWGMEHIRSTEWVETKDGSFYNGYYDNHVRKLEGDFETGTRMTLTSQVFPIMSGTATDEQISEITKAADKLLYVEKMGGYCLNTDFHEVKDDMGRAFGFAYGHKENGAVFAHMAVMYANALYQRGFVKEGFKALEALYQQSADFETSKIYPGLPEYFSDKGRGMYPYLTGSASWLMMTMVTQVYGVNAVAGDLVISPKLVKSQLPLGQKVGVNLEFAGATLHVTYTAKEEKEVYTSVEELYLNGQKMNSNVISRAFLEPGKEYHIEAVLGL